MAQQAYPDVPLFRYPYTDLGEAQVAAALAAPGRVGPAGKGPLDNNLSGKVLSFAGDGGNKLSWTFGSGNRVTFAGKEAGYGSLDLDHLTLFAHLVPGTATGYAVAWDRLTGAATVFELWFGGGPAPRARELNREIYFGAMAGPGEAPKERHRHTLRVEGRAFMWQEDTGNRTIEYYPSSTYSHWVELDRLKDFRGYSAPTDYVQLTEEVYAVARIEAEFSGLLHMYLTDVNRLQQAGLRLGFNGADALEFYLFRGTGEWLGQIARFEKLGDFSADPLPIPNAKKGERRVYRPLATMDKMTRAEVDAAVAKGVHVFDKPSPMAGNGTAPSGALAGKEFAIRYDSGPLMEYRFKGPDTLEWCINDGNWIPARYNAWEMMPGAFIFGHLLEGQPNHDGHIVVVDLQSGMATNYHGYLNTPYFANEAGCETLFGKVVGQGIPDPGRKRHERTRDMLGRAFTWEYSPGLNSMHLYSTPWTTSWIIPTPDGHFATEWCGSGDFVKIRDQLYFGRWQEEACNGTLGTVLINMRTMHDAGIGYHCGKQGGLSMSAVGAPSRHAGKFDVERFFPVRKGKMTMDQTTTRRSFLKSGAIVAAPLAVLTPAAAFAADDGSKARLARLEDEKTIGTLHRLLMREVNGGERKVAKGLTALADDPSHELQIVFTDDGRSASCRRACTASFRTEFTGHSTLEQMHRLQGQGMHSREESRELVAEYKKGKHGWAIERVRLA